MSARAWLCGWRTDTDADEMTAFSYGAQGSLLQQGEI